MNTDIAIKISNVSKKYEIGLKKDDSLRETLSKFIGSKAKQKTESFWALKDISFEIKKGDIIGIIGKNGAGKSTLLKILSKITKPTQGKIEINGRIASLLEVGTGFHPELTGEENIYLNGTILGMSRTEVKEKFNEIVSFSGVEKFINTPVKHYSSGMYVRLAFAVAAHLDPEILIVDEVLAVGDADFQKKCLGKMKDVAGKGRTVIFVSHNLAAVKSLCTKGIVIEKGNVKFQGSQNEAIEFYSKNNELRTNYNHHGKLDDAIGNDNIRITFFDVQPRIGNLIHIHSGIDFMLKFNCFTKNKNIDITFEVIDSENNTIFHYGTLITQNNDSVIGEYTVKCSLPNKLLNAGNYSINLIFGESQRYILLHMEEFIQFDVQLENTGTNSSKLPGIVLPELQFTIQKP